MDFGIIILRDGLSLHRESNVLWTESKRAFQWEENFTPGIPGRQRTGPKPDLTYGFRSRKSCDDHRATWMSQYARNLSFEVLGTLRARDPPVLSTVTPGLFNWQSWRAKNGNETGGADYKGSLMNTDYLCFPWAVVEVKHAQAVMSAEEYCQCQLANATACAYDIREKLIRSVDKSCKVPPIIGFTCIGPRLRLWLTYRGDDDQIVSHQYQNVITAL
jgi:hypothetical protein